MEDDGAFASSAEHFARSLSPLARHIASVGGEQPSYVPYVATRFEDQARVVLDARVPVFSFIYGVPPRELLDECRARDIRCKDAATLLRALVAETSAIAGEVLAWGGGTHDVGRGVTISGGVAN
jgi:nitronate monooxygenase